MSYSGGDGSELNPYLIETAAQFSTAVNSDNDGLYFRQIADITTGSLNADSYAYWEGHYDGNGHRIINASVATYGLFGSIEGGTVRNLTCQGCTNTGGTSWYRGIIAGSMYGGLVENCYFYDCSVSGAYAGGVIGDLTYGIVTRCHFEGSVSGGSNWVVGGIVGNMSPDYMEIASVTLCAFLGDVSGGGSLGGIVGETYYANGTTTIVNCYSHGSVTGSGEFIGGIAGYGGAAQCYSICTIASGYGDMDGISTSGADPYSYSTQTTIYSQRSAADMSYPYNEATTYIGWDFNTTWAISPTINDGYPYFKTMGYQSWIKVGNKWTQAAGVWVKKKGWQPVVGIWIKKGGEWIAI